MFALSLRPHHGAMLVASLPAAVWGSLHLTVQVLLVLMALDLASGLGLAIIRQQLDSRTGYKGLVRKCLVLVFIAAFSVGGKLLGDVPAAPVVAAFFGCVELVSITENCAASGLPIPPAITQALKKFKDTGAITARPAGPTTEV